MISAPRTLALISACTALTAASIAHADVIAGYNFDTNLNPSEIHPDATASAFVIQSGTNDGNASTDSGRSTGGFHVYLRTDATQATQLAALADDDWFEFTVGPDGVPGITLTSITLDFLADKTVATNYTATVYLQSSMGGFGSDKPVVASFSQNSSAGQVHQTLTLGPAFASVTEPVTFRLFFSDTVDENTLYILRADNIVVNGVVPEPASLALAAVSIGAMAFRRQR